MNYKMIHVHDLFVYKQCQMIHVHDLVYKQCMNYKIIHVHDLTQENLWFVHYQWQPLNEQGPTQSST